MSAPTTSSRWSPTSLRDGAALHFAEAADGLYAAIHAQQSRVYRSNNGGRTWLPAGAGLPPGTWVTALAAAQEGLFVGTTGHGLLGLPYNGTRWQPGGLSAQRAIYTLAVHRAHLFAGTEQQGVFRLDAEPSWEAVNRGLPVQGQGLAIHTLASDGTRLYANHPFGLHHSADGMNWQAIPLGLPLRHTVTLLGASAEGLFVSVGGVLFTSADQGESWTRVLDLAAKNGFVCALAAQGLQWFAGVLFPDTNRVYYSPDAGETWQDFSAGLPAGTGSLSLTRTRHHLLVGHGDAGVWSRPLPDATAEARPPRFHLEAINGQPFARDLHLRFSLRDYETVTLDLCDGTGQPLLTLIHEARPPGVHEVAFDGSGLPPGLCLCRLTVGSRSQTRQLLVLR